MKTGPSRQPRHPFGSLPFKVIRDTDRRPGPTEGLSLCPTKVFILAGQSNMVGYGGVEDGASGAGTIGSLR